MVRLLLIILGSISLFLGFIGIFLPVFPTTPFIILAAACFAKSSKTIHQLIHQNRYFGSTVKAWEETRTIPRKAKQISITMLNFSIVSSIILVGRHNIYILAFLVLIAISVTAIILHIPTTEKESRKIRETDSK